MTGFMKRWLSTLCLHDLLILFGYLFVCPAIFFWIWFVQNFFFILSMG